MVEPSRFPSGPGKSEKKAKVRQHLDCFLTEIPSLLIIYPKSVVAIGRSNGITCVCVCMYVCMFFSSKHAPFEHELHRSPNLTLSDFEQDV